MSIRQFWKYLKNKARAIDNNVAEDLETPKIPKRIPKYLSLEESVRLLIASEYWLSEQEDFIMKRQQTEEKFNILYARLSRDDDQIGESGSIQNQKMILEKFARDIGARYHAGRH